MQMAGPRHSLLLLPGHACDRAVWELLLPRLGVLADCRIPDFADEPSLGGMAERVLADAPPTFALAGHSMGGRVALEIVRRAPERVERLALLDTGCRVCPKGAAGEEERARRHAMLTVAREQGMAALGRLVVQSMVLPSRHGDAALVDAILAMVARQSVERIARQVVALLERPDASAALRDYAAPLLVICGAEDRVSPVAQNRELIELNPRARFVVLRDCGHMAPMEQPTRVAELLVEWLHQPLPRAVPVGPRTT